MRIRELLTEEKLRCKIISVPAITLYHGTTETSAKKGLRNDDHFNSTWMSGLGLDGAIHLTDSLTVARAYATTGLSRRAIKKHDDDVSRIYREAKKKFNGADPLMKLSYNREHGVSDKDYAAARQWVKTEEERVRAELYQSRGANGFVVSVKFSSKKVLAFDEPFPSTFSYNFTLDLRDILKREKGKFNAVYFPDSSLKPENFKGRLPRSGYYIVKPAYLKDLQVLE